MKPRLIYDGDCKFCRYWVRRWQPKLGSKVDFSPSQEVGQSYPQIPQDTFGRTVVYVEESGHYFTGAEAVFRLIAQSPKGGWLLKFYKIFPPFAWLAELAYRLVARHRSLFSKPFKWWDPDDYHKS